jgi:hypothetical protein
MKTKLVALLAVVACAGWLCAPTSASAQTLILQSAGDYAIFGGTDVTFAGGSGTISGGNVGSLTNVIGFIDSTPFGAGPAVVAPPGRIIIGGGGVNAAADADLITARTGLAGMAYLSENDFTATPTLGGRTLSPGVYHFDVAAGLTGTLTLDANFQDNAYWVFQIGSSMTTAAGAKVELINAGANAGIFWDAGTFITFGATNTTLGNYLAGETITYGDVANGAGGGRFLSLAGVTFSGTANADVQGPGANGGWDGALTYDLSNNVVPVPEPASTSVLIAGFMGLVVGVRRIRRHYSDRKLVLRA